MSYTTPISNESVAAHDLARSLPKEMWATITDGLERFLTRGGLCVDVGVGTGAVGGRLRQRGVDVLGVDCNISMLAALRRGQPDFPAVIGDAQALPVSSHRAALVVMACILHLVDDWRLALREAIRVATPSGVLAVNLGQSAVAGRTGVSRTFLDAVTSRIQLGSMPGPESHAEVVDALLSEGCDQLDSIEARGTAQRTIRDHIRRLEWNPFGWPPGTPQWALTEASRETEAWVVEQFGDIDEPTDVSVAMGFAIFRAP